MYMSSGFDLRRVVNGAVGNSPTNCMGYMNPGASGSGYVATMKLSVDSIPMDGLDPGTGSIVSYDWCEKDDAYIGEINMGTASSFCGINGALWGYDLAVAPQIKDHALEPLFTHPGPDYPPSEPLPSQGPLPVYPVAPLLDAAERLFGRMDVDGDSVTDLRRFPPLPGAHVICANKNASQMGPGFFWSIIGIAVAEDRARQASLFIENCGVDRASATPAQAKDALYGHIRAVAKSMVRCAGPEATYESAFIGGKFIDVKAGEWGCSLACAPYVVLAQDAVARLGEPYELVEMTIDEWEKGVGREPLPPAPQDPRVGGIGISATEG